MNIHRTLLKSKTLNKLNKSKFLHPAINLKINKKGSNSPINTTFSPPHLKKKYKSTKFLTQPNILTPPSYSPSISKNDHEAKSKKFENTKIKGKLLNAINNSIIMPKEKVRLLNNHYHYATEEKEKEKGIIYQNNLRMAKKINVITQKNPELLQPNNLSSRYEDCYLTPQEMLDKKFNIEEQKIIFRDPKFFGLNKEPFKKAKLKMNYNLKDILNQEEKDFLQKRLKEKYAVLKHHNNYVYNKPVIITEKFTINQYTPKLSCASTTKNIFEKTVKPSITTQYNSTSNIFTTSSNKELSLDSINNKILLFSERRNDFLNYKNYKYYKKEKINKCKRDDKIKKIEKNHNDLVLAHKIAKEVKNNYIKKN